MIVMPAGWIAPAPSPCRARNAISAPMLHDTAHSTDPSTNVPIPNSISGLRPNVSASLP